MVPRAEALQKIIFAFRTDFFPRVQFIITTHSPFILSSVKDAVIYDLETKTLTTDLSDYSYETLVESYFDVDKYSSEVKERVAEYEVLCKKTKLSDDEFLRKNDLKTELHSLPKFGAPELEVKLQQIELALKNKKAKNK